MDTEELIRRKLCRRLLHRYFDIRWASSARDVLQRDDWAQRHLPLVGLDMPPADDERILSESTRVNPFPPVVGLAERSDLPALTRNSFVDAAVQRVVRIVPCPVLSVAEPRLMRRL